MAGAAGCCSSSKIRCSIRIGASCVARAGSSRSSPQVFDLIVFLVRNRDRVVSKDDLIAGVWDGRIVSDSTLASRINAARRALDDSGDAQRLIRTAARKGLRFVGAVPEGQVPCEPSAQAVRHQDVTFCRTGEGINIVLDTARGGGPLV